MLLYYITDRTQFPGDEDCRHRLLLQRIAEAARCGVEYIQLREKDLSARALELLARAAVRAVGENQPRTGNHELRTRLLINSRTDIAIATGADGVHLRSDDISPAEVQKVWHQAGMGRQVARAVIGVSCHSPEEVGRAESGGADFAVFGPVFEKQGMPDLPPAGLEALHRACQYKMPVLALGGVTLENARACLEAGAAGIAGIRLFQANDIQKVVEALRGGSFS